MPAAITLTNSTGNPYNFPQERLPLITRRAAALRRGDQSGGLMRIDVSLVGYFIGDSHAATTAQYNTLFAYVKQNQLLLSYNNGAAQVLDNQLVYLADFAEPQQWKEYLTDYSIQLYYFTPIVHFQELPASYASPAGAFTFPITPQLGFTKKPNRSSPYASAFTPAGEAKGVEVTAQLLGTLCGTDAGDLSTQKANMESAFSDDGTLTFGSMTQAIRVGAITYEPCTPAFHQNFTIDISYFLGGLRELEITIQQSRRSTNPLIREHPDCPDANYAVPRNPTGQYLDYRFHAKGESITTIRSLLANEFAAVLIPGGTELAGGRELDNLTNPQLDVQFTMFYPQPVKPDVGAP